MKKGRPFIDPPCPKGYPYRLYTDDTNFILAASKKSAVDKTKNKNTKLVYINSLVSELGHAGANTTLKTYGTRWICKEGVVFYGK